MEKFITAAGTALRISDTGYGRSGAVKNPEGCKPTLVLLHGYLESLEVWDDLTEELKSRLRVISLDLPGHGISEVKGEVHTMEFLADVVRGVLDVLGVDKCILAGHSMGGYAALEFLRKYPRVLEGFVLFSSIPGPDSPEKKEQREREIAIVRSGKKDLLAGTVEKGFAAGNRMRMADSIAELADQVIMTEDEGVVALLRAMEQRPDSREMMRASKVPQLLIFGCADDYISVEHADSIIKDQPQAKVVWLEHSGHMGMIEEPVAAAEAIVDFCMKVSSVECLTQASN